MCMDASRITYYSRPFNGSINQTDTMESKMISSISAFEDIVGNRNNHVIAIWMNLAYSAF